MGRLSGFIAGQPGHADDSLLVPAAAEVVVAAGLRLHFTGKIDHDRITDLTATPGTLKILDDLHEGQVARVLTTAERATVVQNTTIERLIRGKDDGVGTPVLDKSSEFGVDRIVVRVLVESLAALTDLVIDG